MPMAHRFLERAHGRVQAAGVTDLVKLVQAVKEQGGGIFVGGIHWARHSKVPLDAQFLRDCMARFGALKPRGEVAEALRPVRPEAWWVRTSRRAVPLAAAVQGDGADAQLLRSSNSCDIVCMTAAMLLISFPAGSIRVSSRSLGMLTVQRAWVVRGSYRGRPERNPLIVYQDADADPENRCFALLHPQTEGGGYLHSWLRLLCAQPAEGGALVVVDYDDTLQQFHPEAKPLVWTAELAAQRAPLHTVHTILDPSFAPHALTILRVLEVNLREAAQGACATLQNNTLLPPLPSLDLSDAMEMPPVPWQVGDAWLLGSSDQPLRVYRFGDWQQDEGEAAKDRRLCAAAAAHLGCFEANNDLSAFRVMGNSGHEAMRIFFNRAMHHRSSSGRAYYDWGVVIASGPVVVYLTTQEFEQCRVVADRD